MTMRRTPFEGIRYPWMSDTVNAADVQSMGSDIDQSLVQTANLAADFSRFSTVVVRRAAAQSIIKATLSTISFDTVSRDNGAASPLAAGAWWNASQPTRLTAPAACVVLAVANGGVNATGNFGSPAAIQVMVSLNGATGVPNVQVMKYSPLSTRSGQHWCSVLSMWRMNQGDYLEMRYYWTGTPAGPFNTDTTYPPTLSLMQVALPSVP